MKRHASKYPTIAVCAQGKRPPIAVCALEVRLTDDKTRLIPSGQFNAPRGSMSGKGPWYLDEAHAQEVIRKASSRSTDIAVDYEHQILLSEVNGKPAPASGWVDPRSLEWRSDGLYGHVRWTAKAKEAITPGPNGEPPEMRYLSPVFPYDATTGAVLDLLHLALTNTPAIDDGAITELAAARMAINEADQEEDSVKREELIKALGLKADATDEQINQELAALKSKAGQTDEIRQALELGDDDKPTEAVAALKSKAKAAEPDLTGYVPVAVYNELNQQLAVLKQGGETKELEELIDAGLKDGRIAGKAHADWLRGQGVAALKAHLKDAPGIAALKGATQVDGRKPPKDGDDKQLTEEQLAVCKNMGLDPETYRKNLAAQA
jgi:phage I-like protein